MKNIRKIRMTENILLVWVIFKLFLTLSSSTYFTQYDSFLLFKPLIGVEKQNSAFVNFNITAIIKDLTDIQIIRYAGSQVLIVMLFQVQERIEIKVFLEDSLTTFYMKKEDTFGFDLSLKGDEKILENSLYWDERTKAFNLLIGTNY